MNRYSQVSEGGYIDPKVKFHQERRARLHAARTSQEAVIAKYHPPLSARRKGRRRYSVTSEKGVKEYEVTLDAAGNSCTCPHFANRIAPARERGEEMPDCKHVEAAKLACFHEVLSGARRMSRGDLERCLDFVHRVEIEAAIRQALSEWHELGEGDPAWARGKQVYEVNGALVTLYR